MFQSLIAASPAGRDGWAIDPVTPEFLAEFTAINSLADARLRWTLRGNGNYNPLRRVVVVHIARQTSLARGAPSRDANTSSYED